MNTDSTLTTPATSRWCKPRVSGVSAVACVIHRYVWLEDTLIRSLNRSAEQALNTATSVIPSSTNRSLCSGPIPSIDSTAPLGPYIHIDTRYSNRRENDCILSNAPLSMLETSPWSHPVTRANCLPPMSVIECTDPTEIVGMETPVCTISAICSYRVSILISVTLHGYY